MPVNRIPSSPVARRAFSMVEATASVVLVAVLLVGALSAAGTSARFRLATAQRDFAAALAAQLADEIAAKAYGSTTDGKIPEITSGASRASFTTIDSYNGLRESPPVGPTGVSVPGATGWVRRTTVERVVRADPSTATTSETGVKRIQIDVSFGKESRYTMTFLRTAAWEVVRN
ncbi:MAG: hypothetical protein AMXMBFR58_31020 [Phycisphaerae bacterium]|nr:hypothetical protein [Phycisphaerales bacterium]